MSNAKWLLLKSIASSKYKKYQLKDLNKQTNPVCLKQDNTSFIFAIAESVHHERPAILNLLTSNVALTCFMAALKPKESC